MGGYAECRVRLESYAASPPEPSCLTADHFNAPTCCPPLRSLLTAHCFCTYAAYEQEFAQLFPPEVLRIVEDVCVPHLNAAASPGA